MSTKKREVIWGDRIMGANMRAETARQEARKVLCAADRAEAEAWSVLMEGYGGPGATVPNNRPMPKRRLRLAGDRVLPMQDEGEPAA